MGNKSNRDLAQAISRYVDGPGFRRIERATHFLCYRKTNEERAPIAAFK